MIPMFLVRSKAVLAGDELSVAAAYRREEDERYLNGAVRRLGAGCCLHSHLVNMPGKERKKKRMDYINASQQKIKYGICYVVDK